MKAKVIGITNQNFKIKEEEFNGQKLYYTYENEEIEGHGCNSVFARNGNYKLNDEIELIYSKMYKKLYIKK